MIQAKVFEELEERVRTIENWMKIIVLLIGFTFVAVLFLIF
ncbi:MAG: hypothetical protein V3V70_06925 [Candidatus Scalindua sp.]